MILSRNRVFLLGFLVIIFFYLLNRVGLVVSGTLVDGGFSYYLEEETENEKSWYPVIVYKHANTDYTVRGRETDVFYPGDSVRVLLQHGNPKDPVIYTARSFWLYPLFWLILPIVVWSAFSLSYVSKNEKVVIGKVFPFMRKRRNEQSDQNKKLK